MFNILFSFIYCLAKLITFTRSSRQACIFLVKNYYYFGIILVKISNYLCIFSELYILEEATQHFTGKALRIPTVLQMFYHGLEYLFITEFGLLKINCE